MEWQTVLIAFGITLVAGLCTGIGSIMTFFTQRTNTKFLSIALGFSAGVMIYVSMVEIFVKAKTSLVSSLGDVNGNWAVVGAFFAGMILIAVIDYFVHNTENPHDYHKVEEIQSADQVQKNNAKLMRMGVFTALAVGIHNFPEGLATFIAALDDPTLGISIGLAIAIHNIPEGIAIAVPIYFATGNKRRAFKLSFLSGIAEPIGALIGFLILLQFFSDVTFGLVFAAVAGIMVFISLDKLLPTAKEYGHPHLAIYGLIGGMMVMALSLLLFI
jgi:ZIP family zinc transporter